MSDTTDDMEAWSFYCYDNPYPDNYYEPKKRRKIMETITVLSVSKKSREYNGETIWSVKVREDGSKFGVWYSLPHPTPPIKGQTFNVEVETTEGNDGRKFYNATIVKGQPSAQPTQAAATQARPTAPSMNGNRASPYTQPFDSWQSIAKRAHSLARELEPGASDARARLAFVASFLIAFGEGKLTAEVSDDWETLPAQQPAKRETTAAHLHLDQVISDYCKKFNLAGDEKIHILSQLSGKTDSSLLSEREAIQARLKAEECIDKASDYKAELTEAVKAYFKSVLFLDFASKDAMVNAKKGEILSAIGIVGPFKDLLNMGAKDALIKFRAKYKDADDITF